MVTITTRPLLTTVSPVTAICLGLSLVSSSSALLTPVTTLLSRLSVLAAPATATTSIIAGILCSPSPQPSPLPTSPTTTLISLSPRGKMSQTILQYSATASTAEVQTNFLMGL